MKLLSILILELLVFAFAGIQDIRADEADEAYKTGLRYYNGDAVKQDFAAAMEWFKKAADQGNAEAQDKIGSRYENGDGVPQDYAEAVKWYRKAADQGNAEAGKNIERLRKKIHAKEKMRLHRNKGRKDMQVKKYLQGRKTVGADRGNSPRSPATTVVRRQRRHR